MTAFAAVPPGEHGPTVEVVEDVQVICSPGR